MNISYKHDMTHNYMVPDLTEGVCEDDYRIHMLTENHIRGLLPCTLKKINCQSHFFYDITSRQSMEHLYGTRCLDAADIRMLLRGLYCALKEVKKYLLDVDRIILNPDMIYMDIETKEPFFCYLPGYQGDLLQSFRELTAYLLDHLNQTERSAVLLGYEIYRNARIENYSLEKLLQEAGKPEAANAMPSQNPRYPLPPETAAYTPASENTRYNPLSENARHSLPPENARHSLPPEKKAFLQNSAHYKNAAPDSPGTKPPVSSANSVKKKQVSPKTTGGKKEKNNKKEPEKKPSEKSKTSGRIFLIVCFGFAIFLALIAMWLWKLNTTQIGGIIFLLVGFLAYGLSLEGKKNKKAEKQEDKALAKAMEDFQEEPYYEEASCVSGHPVYNAAHTYATASGYGTAPSQESASQYRDASPYEPASKFRTASSHDPASRFRAASSHEYGSEHDMTLKCDTDARYDTSSFFQTETEKDRRFGDTGVLYEENGDYEPHLVLVSTNPRQKDSIILENDCYIIGKLSSQSDIVLEHSSVSRVHAKIQRYGKDYYLCDMNSTNGTFLNGQRLAIKEPVKIQPGDEIAFARVRYQVGIC